MIIKMAKKKLSSLDPALQPVKRRKSGPFSQFLHFQGCTHFRQRLVCSTLSGKPIKIKDIRPNDEEEPGLRSFEASLLRLIEKVTNGCEVEINETGTLLVYRPGFVRGGEIEHDCGTSRAIGWFVEALIPLAIFSKFPFNITLTGITNDDLDPSVDALKHVTLPLLKNFGLDEGLALEIHARGAPPGGGGRVTFRCPCVRKIRPLDLTQTGLVKRVRGVAYATRVSPQTANRAVTSARGPLNRLLPDVYIYTDHAKGKAAGKSPGYAVALFAETTTGCLLVAEGAAAAASAPSTTSAPDPAATSATSVGDLASGAAAGSAGAPPISPEDLGHQVAEALLQEVYRGGCVSTADQSLVLQIMAVGPEDAACVRFGCLTPYSMHTLRHIRDFFGVTFKIKADDKSDTVLLSCMGTGQHNMNRKFT